MYVHTDHHALQWLISIRDPTSKLARLALQLQHYDFEIIHRPGASNGNTDAISRLPCSNVHITAIESPGIQRSNAHDHAMSWCAPVTNSGSRYIVVVL